MLRLVVTTSALSAFAMVLMAACEVAVARFLGLDQYGIFASGLAIATMIGAAIGVGLPQLALKTLRAEFASAGQEGMVACREGALVSKLTLLHSFTLLLVGTAAYIALSGGASWGVLTAVLLPASIAAKLGVRRILTGLDFPREGLVADEIAPVALFAVLVALVGIYVEKINTAQQILVLFCLANVMSVVWILVRDTGRLNGIFSPRLSVGQSIGIYREALHFVPFVFAFIAAKKVDIALLRIISDESATALYAAAAKLAMPGLAISSAVNVLAARRLAEAYKERSRSEFYGALRHGAKVSLLVAAPYYLVIVLAPKAMLQIVFGSDFIPAWDVLLVLSASAFITASTGPFLVAFSVTDMSRVLARHTSLYLAVLIVAIVVLGAWFGALGTAVATCLAGIYYRSKLWQQIRLETSSWGGVPK